VSPECENCGSELHIRSVDKPHIDWVKVVCSECGQITDVSMIRLAADKAPKGGT